MKKSKIAEARALYKEVWADASKWTRNFAKATRILKSVLAEEPDNVAALTCLGAIYSDRGWHRKALELFKKAERIGSTDRNLYRNIAIAMMNVNGKREDAMKYFKAAAKYKPDSRTIEAYFDPQGH